MLGIFGIFLRQSLNKIPSFLPLCLAGDPYLSLCSHLKFKYFNFFEIFLQRNQSDFFSESHGHFTRIKKFLQYGRPTALSSLREDRPQYILKTRIIQLQISFCFRQFFRWNSKKVELIFLPRYFSLTTNI